ncbi:unnamed protein product [Coffea canephora]|uniref:Uncharacterized protein n=1 Tax=Coffea canephora TaxID=49390 RepID=A0A068V9K2_COFCA|nr:unnamed protein product [Coffea canephora]
MLFGLRTYNSLLKAWLAVTHGINHLSAAGHHLDLHLVGYAHMLWVRTLRDCRLLPENDFILAAKINALDLQQLLSKNVGK